MICFRPAPTVAKCMFARSNLRGCVPTTLLVLCRWILAAWRGFGNVWFISFRPQSRSQRSKNLEIQRFSCRRNTFFGQYGIDSTSQSVFSDVASIWQVSSRMMAILFWVSDMQRNKEIETLKRMHIANRTLASWSFGLSVLRCQAQPGSIAAEIASKSQLPQGTARIF